MYVFVEVRIFLCIYLLRFWPPTTKHRNTNIHTQIHTHTHSIKQYIHTHIEITIKTIGKKKYLLE